MKVALSFACIALFYFLMETTTEAKTDSTFRNSNGDILFRKKRSVCVDRSPYQCPAWRRQGYCVYYKNFCQRTCGYCKDVPAAQVCRDNHNLCPSYFPYCRSSKYGSWMRINCAKTCSYCTSKPKPASCQDKNQNCNYWANKGECQKNPGYMLKFCKKSCGRCVKATVKPKPKPTCGMPVAIDARIVGGRFALPGAWPWHVAITSCLNCSKLPFCGGTLINKEWIVTAAHCVQNWLASELYVILGDTNLHRKSGREITLGVKSIHLHNNYGISAPYDKDVALLRLKNPVKFSKHILPACLVSSQPKLPVGTKCTVTGYGRTSELGVKSPRLLQATVPLIASSVCKKTLSNSKITSNMLCAGYAKGGIDACKGDSGGPLVCKRKNGSWQLTGIVSWGNGCARNNQYGVYADVQVLKNWIEKTISQETSAISG